MADDGWTPWRQHFAADERGPLPALPAPRRRPDWFALVAGMAIVGGFALCLAIIGLADGAR